MAKIYGFLKFSACFKGFLISLIMLKWKDYNLQNSQEFFKILLHYKVLNFLLKIILYHGLFMAC